jgi:hypothetical protein
LEHPLHIGGAEKLPLNLLLSALGGMGQIEFGVQTEESEEALNHDEPEPDGPEVQPVLRCLYIGIGILTPDGLHRLPHRIEELLHDPGKLPLVGLAIVLPSHFSPCRHPLRQPGILSEVVRAGLHESRHSFSFPEDPIYREHLKAKLILLP